MEYTISTINKIASYLLIVFSIISCQSMQARENLLVTFLEGAELQIETPGQRKELKHALEDILILSPEQLQTKRYANYRMEAGVWTLPKILSAYFLPPKPMLIDTGHFYSDVTAEMVKSVVKKKLKLLESLGT